MDVKVAKNTRRRQEAWQRVAQHISKLRDENKVFEQERTAQY